MARLVELALIVPVEVGSRLVEAVPAVIDKVPAAADRVKREVVLARFLGKMVVDQGVRELRLRLTPLEHDPARGDSKDRVDQDVRPFEQPSIVDVPQTVGVTGIDVPDVTSLALADYDHLSSAQIVGKLDGLDAAERAAIERYETASRHRRTILGKLEQLRTADM